jgi:putative NADPH-quinone reductase
MSPTHLTRRIAIIQGHPDPSGAHLCHALADAYAAGAERAGYAVDRIDIAKLDFPVLRTQTGFENEDVPPNLRSAQHAIANAQHLLIVYPLWLGGMPALLKGFFEQVFRPSFAFRYEGKGFPRKLLKGKTARIVVTMGMPAFIYRWYYGAHSVKSLERNILGFCGIGPIRKSFLGMVASVTEPTRRKWLTRMGEFGAEAR